jgi:hypothetical protein
MGTRGLSTCRKKIFGGVHQSKGHGRFRRLKVFGSILSAAAIEDPAGKPRLGFSFDPFLYHLAKFLAEVCNFIQFAELEVFQPRLRRGDEKFQRWWAAHE